MQIRLSISSINLTSPYRVESANGYTFSFKTQYGHSYEVGFIEDYMLSDDGLVFQFFILCLDTDHPHMDNLVMKTVIAILEEFFHQDLVSLVYICDTHDGRQSVRQRLFSLWYHQYETAYLYDFSYKAIMIDGMTYYVSLISRKNNPLLSDRKEALDQLVLKILEK